MAVYKRKGSDIYYMDFTFCYRRIFRSTGKSNKDEAREVEKRERQRLINEHVGNRTPYLSFELPGRRKKHSAGRRLLKYIGDKPVGLIDDEDVKRLLRRLERNEAAPATINRYLSLLRSTLTKLQILGLIEKVPFIPSSLPVHSRERIVTPTEEIDLVKYFDGNGDGEMRDLVLMLLNTGLKLTEVLALTPHCFYPETMTVVPYQPEKRRYIPVGDVVKEIFDRRRRRTRGIFKVSPSRVEHEWSKARKALGLEEDKTFVIGALRHTFAWRLMERGADDKTLMKTMGFSSMTATKAYIKRILSGQADS